MRKIYKILVMVLVIGFATPVQADLKIDVTRGKADPMRIAIPVFKGSTAEDNEMAAKMTEVIGNNLERSGLFRMLNPRSFIQDSLSAQTAPRFGEWRAIKAQALVTGVLSKTGDGRTRVE